MKFSCLVHLLLSSLVAAAPLDISSRDRGNSTKKLPGFLGIPIINPDAKNIIPNRYIVVYNSSFGSDAIDAKEAVFAAAIKRRNIGRRSLPSGHLLSTDVSSLRLNSWRAMVVDADDDMIVSISGADEVAYVEADTLVQAQALTLAQINAPPGLVRLSNDRPGADNYVFDDSAGRGVTAYVLDSGIRTTHIEFEGRASWGANFADDADTDEHGHGSHVAGTIAGATFGVAKKTNLVAVKVLDASGRGGQSIVLQGMQFVIEDVQKKKLAGKAVVNMSLGGGFSPSFNTAVDALNDAGIICVVAAGNENQDASTQSPAAAPGAITVGAINADDDTRASFSNFGPDVDIFAPGVKILSVGIKSDIDTKVRNGTSMATPHVAGLAAYLMSLQGVSEPAEVKSLIKNLAARTGAKVLENVPGTTDLIANNGNF